MAYDIEVVSLGFPSPLDVGAATHALNAAQSEFHFHPPPTRLAADGLPYARAEYVTSDVYEWIVEYRRRAGGHRPFVIAVVSAPLRSAELGNLFGSHSREGGKAVFTLHDHQRFAKSTVAYCAYYLLRYAISFVSPATSAHETARACFFDKKIQKHELRESMLAGRFCDSCMRAIQKDLNPEIYSAIAAMAAIVKELEMSERHSADIEITSDRESNAARLSPWSYATIALVALAVAIGLLVFMVTAGDTLVRLGLSHRVFFFLLIPLGMSAGAFAFGVMRSYARFSGKLSLNGNIEAGGVVVAMAALLIAGVKLVPPEDTFGVVARVSCAGAPLTSGSLLLQVETASYSQPINGFGEAHFGDMPTRFRSRTATLVLAAPGYRLHDDSKAYPLEKGLLIVTTEKDVPKATVATHEPTSSESSSLPGSTATVTRNTTQTESAESPKSSRHMLARATLYRVNLLIPTSLGNARVRVDGREAVIVGRTSSVIKLDIPATPDNHQFELDQDGIIKCSTSLAITQNPTTITPCEH